MKAITLTLAGLLTAAIAAPIAPSLDAKVGEGKEARAEVDATSTRSDWVASYPNNGAEPGVDATSTRSDWVASYPSGKTLMWSPVKAAAGHWLPSGPGFLNINAMQTGYKAHMVVLEDSNSWIRQNFNHFKRFLGTILR